MAKRVVIIGGGVIGLCAAWYCTRRGMQVTVIDQNQPRRDGCSFGNAGMLVPSHVVPLAAPGMIRLGLKWMWDPKSPFYIHPRASWDLLRWLWQFRNHCSSRHVQRSAPLLREMHFRSRSLYEELQSSLPDGFGLQQRGLVMLCKTQAGLDEEAKTAELANRFDVPASVLSAEETAVLDPDVTMDVAGSVYYSQDCHLSPDRLMNSLQRSLVSQGCRFLWNRHVRDFISSGRRVHAVADDQDEIPADEIVLSGGVWTMELAKALGISIPMQAGKGYSVTLDRPVQQPRLCSLLHEARVAVTPMGDSLRVGGTMEMAGNDLSVSRGRVQGIIDAMPKYFPAFDVEDFARLQPWVGLRPCSPDGLPYLGRTSKWENVMTATGHAMMGISLAAVSGSLVSELVARETPRLQSLQLLSPDRFQ